MNRRHLLAYLLAGITLPVPLLAKAKQSVLDARSWVTDNKIRVVLDLSGAIRYQTFELDAPPRLILDLHGTRQSNDLQVRSLTRGFIKAARSSVLPNGDTRLVLEFNRAVQASSFVLPPSEGKGHRLVLDVQVKDMPAEIVAIAPAVEPATVHVKDQRDIIVVIDAGHGGKDPGAIGTNGEKEKIVALSIAQMLAAKVNRQKGFKAKLVRNDDIFVPLRKRVDVARKYNADMFVSVHADAAPRRTASGASVFALSEHGATSTMARWMADQENKSDLLGSRELLSLKGKDPMLANVILDMSMNATISTSLDLGRIVLESVAKVAGVHQERVEQAGFAVLKSPDIPSILVETGFISNAADCKRLIDTRHQQQLATAIFSGVNRYFEFNPPMGTYLAHMKNNSTA